MIIVVITIVLTNRPPYEDRTFTNIRAPPSNRIKVIFRNAFSRALQLLATSAFLTIIVVTIASLAFTTSAGLINPRPEKETTVTSVVSIFTSGHTNNPTRNGDNFVCSVDLLEPLTVQILRFSAARPTMNYIVVHMTIVTRKKFVTLPLRFPMTKETMPYSLKSNTDPGTRSTAIGPAFINAATRLQKTDDALSAITNAGNLS